MSKKNKKNIGTSLNQKAAQAASKTVTDNPFVTMLEKALEVAKSGQITNLAVIGTTVNGKVLKSVISGDPLSYQMYAALGTTKDAFSVALREEEALQMQVSAREMQRNAIKEQQEKVEKANGKPAEQAPPS